MINSMESMLTGNADIVFEHRGIQCWVKEIKDKKSPWVNSSNGYFRMFIPGVQHQDEVTALMQDSGGEGSLPNGGRFSYLIFTGVQDEVVVGFDGAHDHNIKNPLLKEEARAQIVKAVDFLLDNKIGFIFTSHVDA